MQLASRTAHKARLGCLAADRTAGHRIPFIGRRPRTEDGAIRVPSTHIDLAAIATPPQCGALTVEATDTAPRDTAVVDMAAVDMAAVEKALTGADTAVEAEGLMVIVIGAKVLKGAVTAITVEAKALTVTVTVKAGAKALTGVVTVIEEKALMVTVAVVTAVEVTE